MPIVATAPSTRTRPARIRSSALRRDLTPPPARARCRRISAIRGRRGGGGRGPPHPPPAPPPPPRASGPAGPPNTRGRRPAPRGHRRRARLRIEGRELLDRERSRRGEQRRLNELRERTHGGSESGRTAPPGERAASRAWRARAGR